MTSHQQTPTLRPEVYGYHDHVDFLKDWLAFQKASQSGFSLRILSKEIGLSVGLLPMVLNRNRNLSGKALAKLLPRLGLNKQERSYLEALVLLGTSDSQAVRLEALEKMKTFGAYRKNNPKELEAHEYLTRWYYVAIRELVATPDFSSDPSWIQERLALPVPLLEVERALKFLLDRGFLGKSTTGKFLIPQKEVECIGGVYRLALSQFHRGLLELAAKSIENTPSERRLIQGHTVAISEENLLKAKEILDRALNEFRLLGKTVQDSNQVYHMELALFPMTRPRKA